MTGRDKQGLTILLLLFGLFAFLYLYNITGSIMDDDEGASLYEAWQLQKGGCPGVAFMAEQQPLFLLVGSRLLTWTGRSLLALRLVSAVQLLAASLVLALVVRKLWSDLASVATMVLVLGSGVVFEQARIYRPDAAMLAWGIVGLSVLLLAEANGKRGLWFLSGCCYGVGVLWKLFGVLPVIGVALYIAVMLLWARVSRKTLCVMAGLFAVGFLLVALGGSLLLYGKLGFYYGESFAQHASIGQQRTRLSRVQQVAAMYGFFWVVHPGFVFSVPLWLLNRQRIRPIRGQVRLLVLQVLSPLVFLGMSRPANVRYLIHLVPYQALLLAWLLQKAYWQFEGKRAGLLRWVTLVGIVAVQLVAIVAISRSPRLLFDHEDDTRALADYVAARTDSTDVVLGDYAGINFLAQRDSVYEASTIAGAQVLGQAITGQGLIQRIEQDQVKIVLIHTRGGYPPPHHLIAMIDYPQFRDYVAGHFELLTVWDRAGQQIEVYWRE